MEASVRILNHTNINRHLLSRSLLTNKQSLTFPPNRSPLFSFKSPPNPSNRIKCISRPSSIPPPIPNPFSSLLFSLSSTHLSNPPISHEKLNPKENYFSWNRAPVGVNGENLGFGRDRGRVLTVVMLGWLGAEEKHLKRYIELYTSKGIHAVSFVIPVKEMLGFDLGRRVEKRILGLSEELVKWLSEKEEDGRERGLVFHTFSNTGWLVYGFILDYLQSRGDFMGKIAGCVIDSGADPEIDPQVWAAGFSAALLKKRSSATLPLVETIEGHEVQTYEGTSKVQDAEPHLVETFLLSVLEKFFSFILNLPDVNRRLTRIIITLSKNQPLCPQLYLYSTADNVIPSDRVELFSQSQKMSGRKVWAYNFASSPHVDHYRSFPHMYTAELYKFLECATTVGHK